MAFRSAIRLFHSLGKGLHRCRRLIMLLIFFASVTSVFLIFSSSELSAKYLLLALLITTWLILLLSLAYFRADDLLQEKKQSSWLGKISHTLRIAFSILLISAFTLLGLTLLWMSVSAVPRLHS